MQSSASAGLVSQEKRLMGHICDANQDQLNFCNSSGSPGGASSIIGSTFDPHVHHHHHADNKSTIGALSRANYRGRLYNTQHQQQQQQQQQNNEDNIEKDSITNSDTTTKDLNIMNRMDLQRNKKLSWQQEDFQVFSNYSIFVLKKILKSFLFYFLEK